MKLEIHKNQSVTVKLNPQEAERLGNLLSRISNRTPNPRDTPAENLNRMLVEVLDL